jgi:hypothetical protein
MKIKIQKLTESLTVPKALQKAGKATASNLTKLTGSKIKSVIDSLRLLHHQSKIHICDYEVSKRGQIAKVWTWGDGDDVREPVMHSKEIFTPRADVASAWLRNPI